jgi:hypothetical protein
LIYVFDGALDDREAVPLVDVLFLFVDDAEAFEDVYDVVDSAALHPCVRKAYRAGA